MVSGHENLVCKDKILKEVGVLCSDVMKMLFSYVLVAADLYVDEQAA